MIIVYACEASDIVDGDIYREDTREDCERRARNLSRKLSEGVAYVVSIDCDTYERVGHKVYINGRVDRVEGTYE